MTTPVTRAETVGSRRLEALRQTIRALEAWGHARAWRGPDPYDGLNATRLLTPLKRTVSGRRVLTQLVKRSPLDLRPLLGIPAGQSPVSIAHCLSTYSIDGFCDPDEREERLIAAAARLMALRCGGYDESCWGYHFPVQTRVFSYEAGAPNTIATAFAGLAMLDAYEHTGKHEYLDCSEGAGDFFLRHVPQTQAEAGAFFGYLVGDRTPIHNANMLVCGLLARLAVHLKREDFRRAALSGILYTVAHQRDDGSWPYGEQPHLHWVDNFHSGYVLDSLMAAGEAGFSEQVSGSIENGLRYYRSALFTNGGAPKYGPQSLYPVDSQCIAQGIQTFAIASSGDDSYLGEAWRVFDYARSRMWRPGGPFVFQRRRLWANRTPHMRWVIAPLLLALTHLHRATENVT